jgi:isopenicillin N synthase-like dioxygenase
MVRYFKTLEGVGERMLPVLARSLDMRTGHFAPFFDNEAHVNLRFLHYPPQDTEDDEQFGQGPHTDNSFITMLAREDVPGLAVRLPSGEWLAPVSRGLFSSIWAHHEALVERPKFLSTPTGVERFRHRPLLDRFF